MNLKTITLSFVAMSALLISLSFESKQTITHHTAYEQLYINQFKLTYFRRLLNKSYNNSMAVREIIDGDHSGFQEPILSDEDYELIEKLTYWDNKFLIMDSARGHLRAEGAQGKRPFDYIMKKLSGKWLDSLATARAAVSRQSGNWP